MARGLSELRGNSNIHVVAFLRKISFIFQVYAEAVVAISSISFI